MIGKSNHPQIEREKAEVQRMARSSSSEEVVLDLKTASHNNEAKRQEGRGRAMTMKLEKQADTGYSVGGRWQELDEEGNGRKENWMDSRYPEDKIETTCGKKGWEMGLGDGKEGNY